VEISNIWYLEILCRPNESNSVIIALSDKIDTNLHLFGKVFVKSLEIYKYKIKNEAHH
jgi:hypothetical protein